MVCGLVCGCCSVTWPVTFCGRSSALGETVVAIDGRAINCAR
jgi:hypothetical protein